MKSPPAKVTGNKRWHLLKLQQLSSHCRSDYFGSTKIVSSNSVGQNKIGHKFCLPKTDPSNSRRITCWKKQLTLLKTCNLYSRHRKVSIPASLVSNNIKPGFHVIVPQLQHPNSQDRRLLGSHGCINHDIPNSQFSKTCKRSDHHSSITGCYKIPKSQICRSSRSIHHDVTESRDHKTAHIPMS